jgi:eukaryotic-like serine/threonine-protein kinase
MHQGQLVQERYALENRLGSGGMAEVWRARDQRLNRLVAIKFLPVGFTDHPEFLVRLFNEARSVAAISDPHVTAVLDYGATDDGPYLVMEYVPGGTLSDLTGEPMQPERAVEIIKQVAEGAGAAHARGIVHRDIKPGNILLGDDGTLKLADFGIASSGVGANMTGTGVAIGSPHYISPEQAMGQAVTPHADVYSMGVCLYELLTGTLPFEGANPTAIAISHVEQTPAPPSSVVPGIDPHLDALVMRCLDKRADARFADGAELAAALAGEVFEGVWVPASGEGLAGAWISAGEDTTVISPSVARDGAPLWRSGLWNKKTAVGTGVALLALMGIGIHLIAQPVVAETKTGGTRHRQHSQGPSGKKNPAGSPTISPTDPGVTPSPSSSPSEKSKKQMGGKQRRSTPSPRKNKARVTSLPSPTSSPTPHTTPSPTPTPTATLGATPVPDPTSTG